MKGEREKEKDEENETQKEEKKGEEKGKVERKGIQTLELGLELFGIFLEFL